MNSKRCIKIFAIVFLLIALFTNLSFASYANVSMQVVSEPIATINLTDKSTLEKKLISKDLSNKEVTLQLTVTNNEVVTKPTGEIMLVIDNSASMTNNTSSGAVRSDLVHSSAKTLISSLLANNTQLKIGIVSFSTNTDVTKEGTLEDAKLISSPSNDSSTLGTAIDSIPNEGPRTDLESGLTLATQSFSSTATNKYMIVLTDGVPNVAVNYDKNYYSDDVISKTKTELQAISKSGINLFTMLTGINNSSTVASPSTKTFGEIITSIFGTESSPTAGKFYNIQDTDIEKTITQTIYSSLVGTAKSLKDITVTDYFPQEIIDNFDFAYVKSATIGTISSKVDTTNRSITWTIPELASGESAVVQYVLKLKENYDNSVLNKIIKTNEKVDVNYIDPDGNKQSKTTDVSPTLKLTEPTILPAAGLPTIIIIAICFSGFVIFTLIRYLKINHDMKQ